MGDERFDTPGPLRSSNIERNSNRRPTSISSRWARCFSPCEENGTKRDKSTDRASSIGTMVNKKRSEVVVPTRDYDSNSFSSDDEQRSSSRLTSVDMPDGCFRWVNRSGDQGTGVGSNLRAVLLPRQYARNCDYYSENISDTSENESEDTMDLGISDSEGKKEEFAKKWSVIVEGGRLSRNKPSVRTLHRVNADLDRYEKGAGVINYNITVKKIMKTDSHIQFSTDLRRPRRSPQATSTPKSAAGKLSQRSSPWIPSSRRSSCRDALIRESSPSPRRSVRRRIFPNSASFSGKFGNSNDFSPSRGRYLSPLLYSNARKEPPPPTPRPRGRRFSSPPLRRSHSSGSFRVPPRNARSDSTFRRVTFADASMGSYRAARSSLTRNQEHDMNANISSRYTTESPPRRSIPRYGSRRSQSPPRASNRGYGEKRYEKDAESKATRSPKARNFRNFNDYQAFMAKDIKPSESFAEQLRKVRLEEQEADNPFSEWEPDSSRWSRDFENSFDEFMGPTSSTFGDDDDTSSGSLFTDEMDINPRKRLTPRERKLLFHTWNPVFYCNESPGYIRNDNIAKTSMTDPRYRVFY